MEYRILGSILKNARNSSKLKQSEVAEKLGCTPANISSWELGKSKIDIDSLSKLCNIYKIDFISTLTAFSRNDPTVVSYMISEESKKFAYAYDKATFRDKNIARQALDLPPLEPPAKEVSLSDDRKFAV